MWNRLAPFVLRLLDIWSCLALYFRRLLGRHDSSSRSENEVDGNIDPCSQMMDDEADSETMIGGDYDVFLSFRGPDTRHGFADCLYEFMRQAGIRVYRDNEELQPGERISEILRAVKSSRIFIPIFSKGYASSKWCLEELTYMVESTRQSTGKKILPVFYDVDPVDVKLETELYNSALNKLEVKCDFSLVKAWKEALTTVSRVKGWHLKDQRHGKAMTEITRTVLRKIAVRKRCLPTNLVGIDDRVEDIKKLLNCLDTNDVRFVIIHGLGGIGKTTLAKAVFNQLSSQFEGHSFLSNIPDSSPSRGIQKMQRKLVEDLFNFLLAKTSDFEDGNNVIRDRLPNERVLLVFDGMDESDQFMQLAKWCTWCGPGSRIIITTRDKGVFSKIKVEGYEENMLIEYRKVFLYEMKEMHFDHALQLFNKLAFSPDLAPSDAYDLSREVVALTGALPLAIEVIGSHLRTISREKWESTLKKLKRVPREEVQRSLKISYDALGWQAKQIFLDIACFFINKKITDAMYMWEACDLYPEVEIDVLISKSLIKVVERDKIWMHDQLRDLGREIVCEESIGKPGDRSRLWFLDMAMDIVRAKKGTENVVALTLWRCRHNFTRENFANLMNVRFLELDGGNFAGNFEDILPQLRWLCWRNCPPKLQANNFVLNHLVVLKLSGDISIEEWNRWAEMMVASKLKVLKIAGSKSLRKTPCFSKFKSLERLILKDCPRLTEIDRSIGKLGQLIYLKIKWCPQVSHLPEEIGCLTSLRELILIRCFSVRYLPASICNLRGLSRLTMDDTGLARLPFTIKWLQDLEYISLVNCANLWELPDGVGKLRWLTVLDVSGTNIKELPPSIWQLQDLVIGNKNTRIIKPERLGDAAVWRSGPKKWTEVPLQRVPQCVMSSYDALGYEAKQILLDIACFFVNKDITDAMYMWEACHLCPQVQIDILLNKSLIVGDSDDRIKMPDEFRYFGWEIVRSENIQNSGDRSRLWVPEMALDVVRAKKGTENLVALTLGRSRHNFTREEFANLMNVKFLELDGGNFAGNFKDILPELRWLRWRHFPPKLQANNFVLNHLVVLKLSGDITLEEWSRWVKIMVPSKLKALHLAGSKSLVKTPCFSEFMNLEKLVLKDCLSLTHIDPSIGKLERLICLKIKFCPLLRELPKKIGKLEQLIRLDIKYYWLLSELPEEIGKCKEQARKLEELARECEEDQAWKLEARKLEELIRECEELVRKCEEQARKLLPRKLKELVRECKEQAKKLEELIRECEELVRKCEEQARKLLPRKLKELVRECKEQAKKLEARKLEALEWELNTQGMLVEMQAQRMSCKDELHEELASKLEELGREVKTKGMWVKMQTQRMSRKDEASKLEELVRELKTKWMSREEQEWKLEKLVRELKRQRKEFEFVPSGVLLERKLKKHRILVEPQKQRMSHKELASKLEELVRELKQARNFRYNTGLVELPVAGELNSLHGLRLHWT